MVEDLSSLLRRSSRYSAQIRHIATAFSNGYHMRGFIATGLRLPTDHIFAKKFNFVAPLYIKILGLAGSERRGRVGLWMAKS